MVVPTAAFKSFKNVSLGNALDYGDLGRTSVHLQYSSGVKVEQNNAGLGGELEGILVVPPGENVTVAGPALLGNKAFTLVLDALYRRVPEESAAKEGHGGR